MALERVPLRGRVCGVFRSGVRVGLSLAVFGGGSVGLLPDGPATAAGRQVAQAARVVTRVTLQSTTASVQNRVPVTFGHVFAPGDVPGGQQLRGIIGETGERVPLQANIKAYHADGSMRHAVLSTMLPSLPPGATRTLVLERGPAAEPSGPPLTTAGLLASGYESQIAVTLAGRRYSVSARPLLSATPVTWIDGPVATEWIVSAPLTDAAGRTHPHLTARFHVRAFAGYQRVRTDVVVENVWTYEPDAQNILYDVSIAINQVVQYSRAGLRHLHHARWRQTFWSGGNLGLHIAHDARYLLSTGALPNYDPALIGNILPSHLQFYRDFWRHEDTSYDGGFTYDKIGPMGLGLATPAMRAGGAHDDIGPLPRWAAVYVLSQDTHARIATLGMGDLAGSWPIHYRDKKTGLPVSLDDYPYASTTDNRNDTLNPATGGYEQTVRCGARDCASPYDPDTAHQPSFAYLPYVITGDLYYLEELHFWVTYNFLSQTPAYRGFHRGLSYRGEQDRAQAWNLRTLGHAAYITPDAHPLKGYFKNKLDENISFFLQLYVVGQPNAFGALKPTYSYPLASPWMDDFWTWSVGHLVQLGFENARPLARWKARFPVQRMGFDTGTPSDYCWIFGAPYQLVIAPGPDSPMFRTIQEVYNATNGHRLSAGGGFNDHGLPCASAAQAAAIGLRVGEMIGYAASASGYPANMQPALAAAVDAGLPGSAEAWARFEARPIKPDYRDYPVWAVVPRGMRRR